MFLWVLKMLKAEKGMVLMSVLGAGFALLLVLMFEAVFTGESTKIVSYIENTKPDVWVMQRGIFNMHMANSYIWDWKADSTRKVKGVKSVTPILYANTMINVGGSEWFSFVVGLDPDGKRAGPWSLTSGKSMPEKGEIIIPEIFADLKGISIGDQVTLTDKKFRVVGFTSGTFSMANSVVFIMKKDLEEILSSSGLYSYLLVDARPGIDPKKLASRIETEVPKVSAYVQKDFLKNDFELAVMMGVEIISFMGIISSALAAIIIAFTAFTLVSRCRKELAIAKSLGFTNKSIYLSAVSMTAIVTLASYLAAFMFSLALKPTVSALVPQVTLVFQPEAFFRLGWISILIAALASLVPAYSVSRVDPLTAFKV